MSLNCSRRIKTAMLAGSTESDGEVVQDEVWESGRNKIMQGL